MLPDDIQLPGYGFDFVFQGKFQNSVNKLKKGLDSDVMSYFMIGLPREKESGDNDDGS